MKDLKFLSDLSDEQAREIEGGFIPLVILGVAFTAGEVAAGAGAVFIAGMGIGAAVAAQ